MQLWHLHLPSELEQQLQLFVQFVIVAHSMLGVVAFKIAQDKPWRNPALCALQVRAPLCVVF